jgi:hypothetical protein
VDDKERADHLREQTACGQPKARVTSGLIAYIDGEPAGWCAVEPRTAYVRLLYARVPWADRTEDETDDGVWAVTCFITRTGFRRRGVSRAIARAAVDFASCLSPVDSTCAFLPSRMALSRPSNFWILNSAFVNLVRWSLPTPRNGIYPKSLRFIMK